uniref:Uncharacterized protein n=1 Tax=Anguilla anguilla TaxID=7936 RepID=A0A0E9X1D6_ANGAN
MQQHTVANTKHRKLILITQGIFPLNTGEKKHSTQETCSLNTENMGTQHRKRIHTMQETRPHNIHPHNTGNTSTAREETRQHNTGNTSTASEETRPHNTGNTSTYCSIGLWGRV